MREEVRWQWRIQWCGRWTTTRYYATEDMIRGEHPEAKRIDASAKAFVLPETPEELAQAQYGRPSGR